MNSLLFFILYNKYNKTYSPPSNREKKALNSRYYVGKIRVEGANKRRFTSEQSTKNSSDSQRHTSSLWVFFSVNEFKVEINLIK